MRSHIFDEFYAAVKKRAVQALDRIPPGFDDYPWFQWMIDNPNGTVEDAFFQWETDNR